MPWVAGENARYNRGTSQADDNAMMIADILSQNGFSAMSTAAVLGNIQHEGIMNPWYWEGPYTPTQSEAENWPVSEKQKMHGYGFFQYTPYDKYINPANSQLTGYAPHFRDLQGNASDGNAQILFMLQDIMTSNWSTNQYGYYAPSFLDQSIAGFSKDISEFYGTSVEDFIAGVANGNTEEEQIENLTGVFELQYEAPSEEPPDPDVSGDVGYRAKWSYWNRVYSAQYYYDLIKDAFTWEGQSSFKLFMYLKPWWKRRVL